jgi:predicted transcriptional regulator of viral defense system
MKTAIEEAKQRIRELGGTVRTREALAAGIHPRTLYALRDGGELEKLSWGVYRLTELPELSDPDLAAVAKRIPEGVICLVSGLAVHELTTQIPHAVHLALPRGTRYPTLDHPPLRVYLFSNAAFLAGIEKRNVDGVPVRVYDAEKTLADSFKFRHKIGLDVVTEALRTYRRRPGADLQKVYKYARVCRVANVIRPYLEAGL